MKYILMIATAAFMGAVHAGDKMHVDEMDKIVFGHPVFNGFVPPVVSGDDESEPKEFPPVPYLDQPKLHGPLTPNERVDVGHSAFDK